MIQQAIKVIVEGGHLSRSEAYQVMQAIMLGDTTPAQIGAFLVAEKLKGETSAEVAGFAQAMREQAAVVKTRHVNAIDMCGTGGDGSGTFNVSTVASFVVAAGGVPVAKHGNRSVSSQCGSADLLEALGVHLELQPQQLGICLDEIGIAFLYAPALHKAMKFAVGPRREIGVRTVFNILGPLTNPAGVQRQVLGVYSPHLARLMAEVLRELGARRVLIVHSDDGLDEVSVHAPTLALEVLDGEIRESKLQPEQFSPGNQNGSGIGGDTPAANAELALAILQGREGPARDIVIANAACGLLVGGAVTDLGDGVRLAQHAIDSGAALTKLEQLREFSQRLAHESISA